MTAVPNRPCELAFDVFEVNLSPTFGQLAIGKSATLVDIDANPPTSRGNAQEFARLRCVYNQIRFHDFGSFEAHSGDGNMFVGNSRVDLTPEHPKAFPSAREGLTI